MLRQVDAKRKEQLKKLHTDQTKKKAKKQKQYQEAVNITKDEKPQNLSESPRNEKNNEEYRIEGNKYHKDDFLTEDVGQRKNRDININFFFHNSKVGKSITTLNVKHFINVLFLFRSSSLH